MALTRVSGNLIASGVSLTFDAGNAALPALTTTGDTNTGIFFPAADTIAFTEGGTESMRITSAGNVGIGTSSPQTQLAFGVGVFAGVKTYTTDSQSGIDFYRNSDTSRRFLDIYATASGNDASAGGSDIRFLTHSLSSTVSATERARIPSTGGIQSVNSISVGNATPSTSGAGITFPATQSASSDANTLDDYEEGTFTPTLVGASTAGTTTYTAQTGLYTKIGRQVTYIVNLVITATTGTGAAVLGGFPFTFNSTVIPVAAMDASALNWTGGTYLIVMPEENTTTAYIFGEADDANRTTQNITNETQVIRFTLTHFV